MKKHDRRYLAFDIETAKVQPPDERDWRTQRPLGISCAATFLADPSDEPVLWHGVTKSNRPASRMSQQETVELVEYLTTQVGHGHTIVTWNGVGLISISLRKSRECLKNVGNWRAIMWT